MSYSMSKTLPGILATVGLWFLSSFSAWANSLQAIKVVPGRGGSQEVQIELKDAIDTLPIHFTTSNPHRIVLDFAGTDLPGGRVSERIGRGMLRAYNAVQAGDRTRVVIDLTSAARYDLKKDRNRLTVAIQAADSAPAQADAPRIAAGRAEPVLSKRIRGVDFRRGPNGEARIEVGLSEPGAAVDVRQRGQGIQVDFLDTALPTELQRRLDVTDFATPAQTIETTQMPGLTRMLVTPRGKWDFFTYQTGDQFTLEVRPVEDERLRPGQRPVYSGEKLTLDFQDTPVRQLLYVIGEFTGKNIVINDSVSGNITIKLRDVPWDQALDIILKQRGLDKRVNGNVILVAPSAELQALEKQELEARRTFEQLADLVSVAIKLNYARADEVVRMIRGTQTGTGATATTGTGTTGTASQSLLSPRGSISSDLKTNTLFVKDTPSAIQSIEDMIKVLDIPVRQVMIDARVVIAQDTFSRDLGARLRGSITDGRLAGTNLGVSIDSTTSDKPYPYRLSLFNAASTRLVDLEVQAAEADGRSKTISNPRVITSNLTQASISQGQSIPYKTTSSEGTRTEFAKANLALTVTPQILNNDEIILDVTISKDNVGGVTPDGLSIDTRNVTTQVRMRNGETVVLGGIFDQAIVDDVNQVPLLGRIPVLGWLFKHQSKSDTKSELLVFITPRILSDEGVRMR